MTLSVDSAPVPVVDVLRGAVEQDYLGGATYVIRDQNGEVVYVGQTRKKVRERLRQHCHQGTAGLTKDDSQLSGWTVALTLKSEAALVQEHSPKHNSTFRDRPNRKRKSEVIPQRRVPPAGQWFHSFNDLNEIEWQGQVLSSVGGDMFLVQLYEWFVGSPSVKKLVSSSQMAGWSFYDAAEDMRKRYEEYSARQGGVRC